MRNCFFVSFFSNLNSKLHSKQFGFQSQKSSVLQLIDYLECVYQKKSRNRFSVLFDYEKAFDKVPHSILLRKLSLYLDYDFCSLFQSYLMNRYQYVHVNDFSSDLLPCVSGVAQGSVFGPFLFLIFVNDLPSIFLDCMVWLFADDLKLLFSNLNFNDDLWRLYFRNLINGMIITSDKTKCLHFSGTAQITFPPDLLLENVNSHKKLGVYVGFNLKWNLNVAKKLHWARQSFFALKSKVPFTTPSITKLKLNHSMVLSILLYDFPAWYPDITSLKRLESFQRSCFSWIFGRKQSYQGHLKISKFPPICYHLEYITLSFLCQLLDGKYIFNFTPYLVFQVPERQLRASTTKMLGYLNPKRSENVSFFGRAVSMANFLFRYNIIDGFNNFNKHAVKAYLLQKEFNPTLSCSFFLCCTCSQCNIIKSIR